MQVDVNIFISFLGLEEQLKMLGQWFFTTGLYLFSGLFRMGRDAKNVPILVVPQKLLLYMVRVTLVRGPLSYITC